MNAPFAACSALSDACAESVSPKTCWSTPGLNLTATGIWPPPFRIRFLNRVESSMARSAAELSRTWLIKAHNDLHTAQQIGGLPDGHLDAAIYHCQQAAEKTLK